MQLASTSHAMKEPARRVGTASAMISILMFLSQERRPIGVSTIARHVGLATSSCANIMKSLVAEGWATFDQAAKTYYLGPAIVRVMRHALDPGYSFELVESKFQSFAANWSVTSGIWQIQGPRLILAGYVSGAGGMQIHLNLGQRLPLLIGSAGRCAAAFCGFTRNRIEALYGEAKWQSSMTYERFLQEVEETAERGWAVDAGDFIKGATTISVPLFDDADRLRYCLFTTMFSGQHPPEIYGQMAAEMKSIAAWCQSRLFPSD